MQRYGIRRAAYCLVVRALDSLDEGERRKALEYSKVDIRKSNYANIDGKQCAERSWEGNYQV